ncbi:MAG: TonB-dependent receptor [Bacteroidetes bacterium]|nr:TonB-dependent receptor [Bacteroidota bacterium]
MTKYLILVFILFSKLLFSQDYILHGKVIDANSKSPLQGVIIGAHATGTVTDELGNYVLKTGSNSIVITFKLMGYESKSFALNLTQSDNVLDVQLKPSNNNLDEVVVTASKFEQKIAEVTSSVETLKPKLIEASGNLNMQTAVEQVSGVNVVKGQVNIRGGSGFSYGAGSRVLMLIDDLPVLSPDAGDIKWDFLPTENVQQVEVIKGASSALFGSSALGGIINLRTASPSEKPETKIRVFTGVYDNYEKSYYNISSAPIFNHGIYASHSRKIRNHDFVFSAATVLDNQYHQDETTKYGRFTTNYKYHFQKVKGLAAGTNFNFYRQRSNTFLIWKNDSNPLIAANGTLTKSINNRFYIDPYLTYISPQGHRHSFRNRYYYNDNTGIEIQKNDYKSSFIYSEYQYQKSFTDSTGNELKFTLGAVNTFSKVQSDSIYGNKSSDNAAVYMQAEYKLKRILFSFGSRAEYFNVDTLTKRFVKVLRAGLNWHLATATYFRASVGEGYRMPAVAELYATTSSGTLNIFPNPNLQPESGWGTEMALKQGFLAGSWKGMVDIAAFRTQYKNMIEFIFDYYPPTPSYLGNPLPYLGFKARNYTNARITGIETSFAAEGEIKNVKLTLSGGFTKINPINLDSIKAINKKDRFLKYRNNDLLRLNVDFGYPHFTIGSTLRYNSFMTNIDEAFNDLIPGVRSYREQHTQGDWIFDFRASYKIVKFNSTVAFIIKNLTNHEYMFAPANIGAPRYFMVQYSALL